MAIISMVMLVAVGVLYVAIPVWAENRIPLAAAVPPPSTSQGKKIIILDHADRLEHDQLMMPDIIVLAGSVQLRHGSWIMHCDSAHLNEVTNSFDAFGHIRIEEGDSITITAGTLNYDGIASMAVLSDNVILRKNVTTLFTEELFYDRTNKLAYYSNFGTLADSVNTLTSMYGEYNTGSSEATFEQQVHLENDRFTMDTEILHYNTDNTICQIVSPTYIQTTDSVTIETDRGFYNTTTEQSILLNRSLITHPDGTMTGDSIHYDKQRQIGQAYYDVEINNQSDQVIYYGDYGYMDQLNSYFYATGRAYAVDYSEPDSLYLTADILEGINQKRAPLRVGQDSIEVKYIKGYHHAKLYRKDIQAIGDSLNYFSADSLIKLFGAPILWNDSLQLKGDTIYAHLTNDTIDYARAWQNASTVSWIDDEKQNRIKADSIEAFFIKGDLDHAFYRSAVESRYYMKQDRTDHYYALAQVANPRMDVYVLDQDLDHILWHGEVKGTIHPIETLTEDLRTLAGAEWHGGVRPKKPQDIIPDRSIPLTTADSLPALIEGQARTEFDGLQAWQTFYSEYQKILAESPVLSEQKAIVVAPSDTETQPLSIYIRRPEEEVTDRVSPVDYSSLLPIVSWHSYFDPVTPDDSVTNQSIGILRRKTLTDASSRSDKSSLLGEKSPQ